MLPPHRADVRFRQVLRFKSDFQGATAILPNGILGACGSIGTVANTTVASFCTAFKIHSITIYAANQGQTVTLDWNGTGGAFNPGLTYSITCTSSSQPVKMVCVPPKDCNAAFWQGGSATTLFTVTMAASTGVPCYMDLDAEFVFADQLNLPIYNAVGTAVVGTVYYLALDAPTTARWTPVDRPTTS